MSILFLAISIVLHEYSPLFFQESKIISKMNDSLGLLFRRRRWWCLFFLTPKITPLFWRCVISCSISQTSFRSRIRAGHSNFYSFNTAWKWTLGNRLDNSDWWLSVFVPPHSMFWCLSSVVLLEGRPESASFPVSKHVDVVSCQNFRYHSLIINMPLSRTDSYDSKEIMSWGNEQHKIYNINNEHFNTRCPIYERIFPCLQNLLWELL